MFSSVLKEVTGVLDRHFLMNAFFPSLVFWALLSGVWVIEHGDVAGTVQSWDAQGDAIKALQVVGLVAWIMFSASVLASQWNAILRVYEGYWDYPLLGRLGHLGRRWHQSRLANLAADNHYEAIYLGYPLPTQPDAVMPTRLGNILRNAELYPADRYGANAVLIWPRLYNLFPERFIETIAGARSGLDFLLVVSSLSALFALMTGVYLIWAGAEWWFFLVCFWGGAAVAWVAYQGALGNAFLYAQQIKAAFDLYRNDLLKQMRLNLPDNSTAEPTRWAEVTEFLYGNVRPQPAWQYEEIKDEP